jgi:Uma2 family endonuclease
MTVLDLPTSQPIESTERPQRFVFSDVDWPFYQEISRRLEGRGAFVTYYKGRLEVVTTSLLHELTSGLIAIMISVMAEEADIPMMAAKRSTLDREDLDEGTEPDESFYIANELRMRGRTKIDLAVDPPPDLAIEVEVTRRLGARRNIYRDLGVPEIWVYGAAGLQVQIRQDGNYVDVASSPTFPLVASQEMTECIRAGLKQDQTAFTKAFRRRVRELRDQRGPAGT